MKDFSALEKITNKLIIDIPHINLLGLDGKSGAAIFFYNLFSKTDIILYREIADELIDDIFSKLDTKFPLNYSSGLAGIGCAIEYIVSNNYVEADLASLLDDFDNQIFQFNNKRFNHDNFLWDYYGPGLYYLKLHKYHSDIWKNEALNFILKDLYYQISLKSVEISDKFLVSLAHFASRVDLPIESMIKIDDFIHLNILKNDNAMPLIQNLNLNHKLFPKTNHIIKSKKKNLDFRFFFSEILLFNEDFKIDYTLKKTAFPENNYGLEGLSGFGYYMLWK